MEVLPKLKCPAAIVIPTPLSIPASIKEEFEAAGHAVLALSEIVEVDAHQELTGILPAEQLLNPVRVDLLAGLTSRASKRLLVLPDDARWELLTLDFTDAEVVLVRYAGQTRRFEPTDFGFRSHKTGKPTTAWRLLLETSSNAGRLPRPTKLRTKVEKQKQLLSKRLVELFGISDDPLPWRSEEQAYVARFGLRDSRPKGARNDC